MTQPVVRALLLPAVAKLLPKDAVLVAHAVAHRRELECGHRVEETGRQPAEPSVAEAGVRLFVENLDPLAAVLVESLRDDGVEHQIHDVVGERPADEEFDREIINPLRILARVSLVRAQPAVRKDVSHRPGGGFKPVPSVGRLGLHDIVELEMALIERVAPSREAHRTQAVPLQEFSLVRGAPPGLIACLRVDRHGSLARWPGPPGAIIAQRQRPPGRTAPGAIVSERGLRKMTIRRFRIDPPTFAQRH